MGMHSRFSFEPEPKGELLQKLGHQLLEMGIHDLAREYFQMAKQIYPRLGQNLLEEAQQLNLAFLDEAPLNTQTRKQRKQIP